jgi:tetratricopeptide (TPR) repeat protein
LAHTLATDVARRWDILGGVDLVGDLQRSMEFGEPAEALAAEVAAMALTTADSRASLVVGWYHWRRQGSPIDLAAAVALFGPLADAYPNALPEQLRSLFHDDPGLASPGARHAARRAVTLLDVALRAASPPLVNACVSTLENAVSRLEAEAPAAVPDVLLDLAKALFHRYELLRDPVDLDRMVVCARTAVSLTDLDAPERPVRTSVLATTLSKRFDYKGDLDDLDGATDAARQAVISARSTGLHLASLLRNLAAVLLLRHDHRGGELATAVDSAREAASLSRPQDPKHQDILLTLVDALRRVGDHTAVGVAEEAVRLAPDAAEPRIALAKALMARRGTGGVDRDDVADAVRAARNSLAHTSPDSPHLSRRLIVLCLALVELAKTTKRHEPLHDAVDAGLRAAAAARPGDPAEPLRWLVLGSALQHRYDALSHPDDLRNAGLRFSAALKRLPYGHAARPTGLTDLSVNLRLLAGLTGRRKDFDRAVRAARRAVAETLLDDRERPARLCNLGVVLLDRAEVFGRFEDGEEAAEVLQEAVDSTPADHPDHSGLAANLASALLLAARDYRVPDETVGEAVRVARSAVAGASGTDEAVAHSVLCGTLLARHTRFGVDADLAEAVGSARAAAELTPAGSPLRARYLTNLAGVLILAARAGTADVTPEEAVEVARKALNGGTETAVCSIHLAMALRLLKGAQDEEAVECFRTAAEDERAPVPVRIRAAAEWADLSVEAERWPTAFLAARAAVELLDQLDLADLRRDDQERLLADLPGLAADAAACAVRAGDLGAAVELLERGRGVLLRLALNTPTAVAEEHHFSPETDATEGPVVLLNVSRYGSDALVLTTAGVNRVPLPSLTMNAVRTRVRDFLGALEVCITARSSSRSTRDAAEQVLTDVLGWLWRAGVRPVVENLGWHAPPPGVSLPRLWLCPVGLLALLPVHAAGEAGGKPGTALLDHAVVSLTSTLRELRHARRTRRMPLKNLRVLVVSVPEHEDLPKLPGARLEADLLEKSFPGAVTRRDGSAAVKSTVLREVHNHVWAHYTCHAVTDLAEPVRSGLAVQGGPNERITVSDLVELRYDDLELAYLSACDTARTSPRVVDEAVHLLSAFQLCGYRSVVGSLWPVYDRHGVRVATEVYRALVPQFPAADDSAAALHGAVRLLRRVWADSPSIWAGYVHAGR